MRSVILRALASATLLFTSTVIAQGSNTAIVYPTLASSGAVTVQTALGYKYAGCYNESMGVTNAGGVRAIEGNNTATNDMTIEQCLNFCGNNRYAGLEYGRECYCSPYLSSLSVQLNSSSCNYACDGNATQICGGMLAISLYNRTGAASSFRVGGGGVAAYATAALVTLLVAAWL